MTQKSFIRAQFVQNRAFSSRLIEWFGGGNFSHVDALLPDGRLLGARSDAVGGRLPGVEIRQASYEKWPRLIIMELEVGAQRFADWNKFLTDQLHKPYDKLAIFGFAVDRDWRENDSWFCSELFTRSLEVAGVIQELPLTPNKVTPGAAACIFGAAGAKVTKRLGWGTTAPVD